MLLDPSDQQIVDAVDSLNPDGGPGFLILDAGGDDYVQSAGGNGEYVVEWREYSDDAYAHYVAGVGPTSQTQHDIRTNGYFIAVRANEVLSAADVKTILLAFRHKGRRPSNYTWRDDTARYLPAKPWWQVW